MQLARFFFKHDIIEMTSERFIIQLKNLQDQEPILYFYILQEPSKVKSRYQEENTEEIIQEKGFFGQKWFHVEPLIGLRSREISVCLSVSPPSLTFSTSYFHHFKSEHQLAN